MTVPVNVRSSPAVKLMAPLVVLIFWLSMMSSLAVRVRVAPDVVRAIASSTVISAVAWIVTFPFAASRVSASIDTSSPASANASTAVAAALPPSSMVTLVGSSSRVPRDPNCEERLAVP